MNLLRRKGKISFLLRLFLVRYSNILGLDMEMKTEAGNVTVVVYRFGHVYMIN